MPGKKAQLRHNNVELINEHTTYLERVHKPIIKDMQQKGHKRIGIRNSGENDEDLYKTIGKRYRGRRGSSNILLPKDLHNNFEIQDLRVTNVEIQKDSEKVNDPIIENAVENDQPKDKNECRCGKKCTFPCFEKHKHCLCETTTTVCQKAQQFFEKAQLTPRICFIAVLTCACYLWLYLVIGPDCLASVILALSFIFAFSIAAFIVYTICERENWFNMSVLFSNDNEERISFALTR